MLTPEALECLLAKGLITQEQYNQLLQIAIALPSDPSAVLALLTALALIPEDSPVPQAYAIIGTDLIESDDDESPQVLTVPEGALYAIVTPHENNIKFRLDGEDPTGFNGHFAAQGSNFRIDELEDFVFASYEETSAFLFVSYYGLA